MFGVIRNKGRARSLFAAVFALALALRIAVPSGFMPVETAHGMVVRICDGMGDSKTMVIDLQRSDDRHDQSDHHKPAAPCAFAGLSAPALGTDATVAIAAPAMLLGEFALPPPIRFGLARSDFLTPPLRGPPALA